VAATNRNLEEEVAKHHFRSDLFYRLNVLPIAMPPLRAHAEDVPLLVEYLMDGFNTEFRKRVLGATPAVFTLLQGYGWPGNVRELRNVVERAMLLSEATASTRGIFRRSLPASAPAASSSCPQVASTSNISSAASSYRRSNGVVEIRRRQGRCWD